MTDEAKYGGLTAEDWRNSLTGIPLEAMSHAEAALWQALDRIEELQVRLNTQSHTIERIETERCYWHSKYDQDLRILRRLLEREGYPPEDLADGMVAPQVAEWLHDVEKQRDEMHQEIRLWQEWFENHGRHDADRRA